MRFDSTLVALAAPILVSAVPIVTRQSAAATQNLLVLNFAHVLEQLETQFYQQALQNFSNSDFTNAGFSSANLAIEQFTAIQSDEATHTSTLESVINSLGGQVLSGCQFDFSSILTDVSTMAGAARLIENVGVGAYLGAAHLLSDPSLLTAAASIVTIEARHQSILNVLSGTGSAIPQAFDLPLTPSQVLAIAGPFISGCDTGITANQPLTVSNTNVQAGTELQLSSPAIQNNDFTGLSCQLLVGGAAFSTGMNLSSSGSGCVIPPNTNGPIAVFLTNSSQPLDNNVVDQFAGNQVAGPAILFVDSEPEVLGQLARNTGNSTVSSTTNITPPQASAVASSGTSSGSSSSNSSSSSSSNSGSSSSNSGSSSSSNNNGTLSSSSSSSSSNDTSSSGSSNGTLSSSSSGSSSSSSSNGTLSGSSNSTSSSSSSSNGTSDGTVNVGNGTLSSSSSSNSTSGANVTDTTSLIAPNGTAGLVINPTLNSTNVTSVSGAVSAGTGVTNGAASVGGPNLYAGPSPNGLFTVLGWVDVPQTDL